MCAARSRDTSLFWVQWRQSTKSVEGGTALSRGAGRGHGQRARQPEIIAVQNGAFKLSKNYVLRERNINKWATNAAQKLREAAS